MMDASGAMVVLDTNIWISALIARNRESKPLQVTLICLELGRVAICPPIQHEILHVLVDKLGWSEERARDKLAELMPLVQVVPVSGSIRICRDPCDDMVLECAVNAGAQFIVSGDKDLLSLGYFRGIRIVTPADYLAQMA